LQYNVTGQAGGTWHYRVRAYNWAGDSPWSGIRSTTVDPAPLEPPEGLTIDNDDRNEVYLIDWNDVPTSPVTYTLEESRDRYFSNPAVVSTTNESEYHVTEQPGGTWYYRVRAAGAYGRSPWSGWESTVVTVWTYLPQVMRGYSLPARWVTLVSEDFESSFPGLWSVFDGDGEFQGEYYWDKRDCRAYGGSAFSGWPVGGGEHGGSLVCGDHYPNDAESWMVYGPFSLLDATAAELRFQLWLNAQTDKDGVCRLASRDGLAFAGLCSVGSTSGWVERVLDLSGYVGDSNVWIALRFASDSSITSAEGGYVDDIVLRKYVGGQPPLSRASAEPESEMVKEWPVSLELVR
jgi:hypothetical protein